MFSGTSGDFGLRRSFYPVSTAQGNTLLPPVTYQPTNSACDRSDALASALPNTLQRPPSAASGTSSSLHLRIHLHLHSLVPRAAPRTPSHYCHSSSNQPRVCASSDADTLLRLALDLGQCARLQLWRTGTKTANELFCNSSTLVDQSWKNKAK